MALEKIAIILGSTASGKTASSIEVAKRLNAEIISADSIQVYKGMDIGSAKPTVEEQQGIVHHMLDVVDANCCDFSVARYFELASECIYDIASRSKLPLIVGGTGLYVNSLTYPLNFACAPSDPLIRQQIAQEEDGHPGYAMRELAKVDPDSAQRLHPNDKKRIIRALEVYRSTGRTLTSYGDDFKNDENRTPPFDAVMLGITMPRERLYSRINERVDVMMQCGLLDEVRSLLDAGCTPDRVSMQGLGYKQLAAHILGKCTLDEAIEQIKLETRHFAKRQMTWFRRDKRIHWLDVTEYDSFDALVSDMIQLITAHFQPTETE